MNQRPAKMHEDEVLIDDATVRRLLTSQFPQWSSRPLERVPDSGTDSAIYRLGKDLGIRMPRIHWAVQQIDKEFKWLGRLARDLPTALPVPIAKGEPGSDYPYPWLIYPWIQGMSLDHAEVRDWRLLVSQIADFILELERIPPEGGPKPRMRGGSLAKCDESARLGIRYAERMIDMAQALRVWQTAVEAPAWNHDPVWIHGDLLPGNILVRDEQLAGVIDWSGASVGDPACDAMLAWALPQAVRKQFRDALGFDDATWARARGWVVQQTAMYIPYYGASLPGAVAQAKVRLDAALYDDL